MLEPPPPDVPASYAAQVGDEGGTVIASHSALQTFYDSQSQSRMAAPPPYPLRPQGIHWQLWHREAGGTVSPDHVRCIPSLQLIVRLRARPFRVILLIPGNSRMITAELPALPSNLLAFRSKLDGAKPIGRTDPGLPRHLRRQQPLLQRGPWQG